MNTADPLDLFLPAVRDWFRETLGDPTPPQRDGWPTIAAGKHTLILEIGRASCRERVFKDV